MKDNRDNLRKSLETKEKRHFIYEWLFEDKTRFVFGVYFSLHDLDRRFSKYGFTITQMLDMVNRKTKHFLFSVIKPRLIEHVM